jgi:hypothetical protein
MLYVCAKGRAYQCKAPEEGQRPPGWSPAEVQGDGSADAYKPSGRVDARRCLGAAAAGTAPGTAAGEALWELVAGAVGELEPAQDERWPDCLAASPLAGAALGRAATATEQAQAAEFRTRLSSAPLETLVELREEHPAGQAGPVSARTTRGTGKFKPGAPLRSVVVGASGELCTNLAGVVRPRAGSAVAAKQVERASPVQRGWLQAVGDAQLAPHGEGSALASLQGGAAAKQAHVARAYAADKRAYRAVRAVQALLSQERFTALTRGAPAGAPALEYWDFLAAVATAPAFCTTAGHGPLQGLAAAQVCRRELAGLWALGIANTSAAAGDTTHDAAAAQVSASGAPATTPWEAQGFQVAKDARCARPAGDATRTAAVAARCDRGAAAPATGAAEAAKDGGTAAFNRADGLCAGAAGCQEAAGAYAPRGPARMAGVKDAYWFAKLAQGADVRQGGAAADGKPSALTDPAQLESGYAYWLSGLYKWMVPAEGRPAPHNIMTGQWQADAGALLAGVPAGGFGAVVKLAVPEACGRGAKGAAA